VKLLYYIPVCGVRGGTPTGNPPSRPRGLTLAPRVISLESACRVPGAPAPGFFDTDQGQTITTGDHDMTIAENIFNDAFALEKCREPRSPQYRAGVMALLMARENGTKLTAPYDMGSMAADAWLAGVDEGRLRWKIYQESLMTPVDDEGAQS